jgi:NAD(P)H dehydrogenase (quinone)
MNVMIVYAHPNPESFNRAVLEAFANGLKDGGHSVEIADLYALQFDPRLELEEFVAQWSGEPPPQAVQGQQKKVTQADGLAFIYPVWWWRSPAILEGWVDRVLAPGCAYQFTENGMEGLLGDKKALLINTALGNEEYYKTSGVEEGMRRITQATLTDGCGIQDLEHVFFYAVHDVDDETRQGYLESAYRLGKEI